VVNAPTSTALDTDGLSVPQGEDVGVGKNADALPLAGAPVRGSSRGACAQTPECLRSTQLLMLAATGHRAV